nr:truncated Nla_18150 protein [Neisseria lactamica]
MKNKKRVPAFLRS